MKRLLPILALTAAALIASPAMAMSHADAGGMPIPSDATSTTPMDAGSGPTPDAGTGGMVDSGGAPMADGGGMSDIGTVDVGVTKDGGGTTPDAISSSFSTNACWNEKCPKETKACKDSKDCVALNSCLKEQKSVDDCVKELKLEQSAAEAANTLVAAISTCGYPACADPNASSCGKPGKSGAKTRCGQFDDLWKCSCDLLCGQYGDCCADFKPFCKPTCGGAANCGKAPKNGDLCTCREGCENNKSCCPDFKKLCSAGACKPSCTGKTCGDDGCGSSCGSCDKGATCDVKGQCVVTNGAADAGSTADTSATADTAIAASDTVAADAGSKTAGTTTTATPRQSSGGCTAAASSGEGALPFGLVLVILGGVLMLRRREEV